MTVNTVGSPVPGVEAKIIDADEKTLETEQIGELVTKGYFVFDGYVNDEEKTKESFTKDGWFKTGDLASMRPDGFLKLV